MVQQKEAVKIEKFLPEWVVSVSGQKFAIFAKGLARQGELVLMFDDEDEIVFAAHQDKFQYAYKLRKEDKKP